MYKKKELILHVVDQSRQRSFCGKEIGKLGEEYEVDFINYDNADRLSDYHKKPTIFPDAPKGHHWVACEGCTPMASLIELGKKKLD